MLQQVSLDPAGQFQLVQLGLWLLLLGLFHRSLEAVAVKLDQRALQPTRIMVLGQVGSFLPLLMLLRSLSAGVMLLERNITVPWTDLRQMKEQLL